MPAINLHGKLAALWNFHVPPTLIVYAFGFNNNNP